MSKDLVLVYTLEYQQIYENGLVKSPLKVVLFFGCFLSLDEKPVIFCSAKNFRYFFRFRWHGRKRKCHNNFSFILLAEKKTDLPGKKIIFFNILIIS